MGQSCRDCGHCSGTEWSVLSEAQIRDLDAVRRVRHYLPGELIFHEGDEPTGVYCVFSGLIGLRKADAQGESALLRLVGPGGTLGFRSLLAEEPHGVSAEALKQTMVCHVPIAAARRAAAAAPLLTTRFFKHLARDLAVSEAKVLEAATASTRVRFLRLLIAVGAPAGRGRRPGHDACALELPLSRQDLASMIGVRPESMSRVIRHIEDDGLARFDGRRVVIPDMARVMAECADPPDEGPPPSKRPV